MNDKNKLSETVREIQREEGTAEAGEGALLFDKNVDLVRGVKVRLHIRLGQCELTVGELFDLKENAILELDRDVTAPVDILLDDKLVARGTLVAAGDNFGVRVTEVKS